MERVAGGSRLPFVERKVVTPAGNIKLRQPNRDAPTEQTLLDLAGERDLFAQADRRQKELAKERRRKDRRGGGGAGEEDDDDEDDETEDEEADEDGPTLSPGAERFLEAMLWTVSLAMLHFTFDVLVQNQYGTRISWSDVCIRTATAWLVFLFLFYFLHPHGPTPTLVPGLPLAWQRPLTQGVFFLMSVASGCYLIYITNTHGYLATMKQAPPLGCLWLWAVIELDLVTAVASLAIAAAFLWQGGYDIK
ncbi:deacetylase-like protein [Purpureocillium lavendulum]|uniref:Deacetylase-like protein n=1 Tax=Purpureocillium lavendulum TaxID=1247861 RepID=A0AB34FMC1_9HYPO|nr:deacetylase-like protein [Purpureocillium lavendulum]